MVDEAFGDYQLRSEASDAYTVGEGKVTYIGLQVKSLPPTILAIRARKLIIRGGQAFLVFIVALMRPAKRIWKTFLWCVSI